MPVDFPCRLFVASSGTGFHPAAEFSLLKQEYCRVYLKRLGYLVPDCFRKAKMDLQMETLQVQGSFNKNVSYL
jgi:hypothetical protein